MITTSTVPGVTVTPQDGSQSPITIGQNYAFTVTLPGKYDPATLVVKAGNDTLTDAGGVYNIFNIQENTLISVNANIKTFTLTTSAGTGGAISPTTKTVGYGVTVNLLPSTGYEVDTFTVNGEDKKDDLSRGTYTASNITANTSVAVTYKAKQLKRSQDARAHGRNGKQPDFQYLQRDGQRFHQSNFYGSG